MPAFSTIDGSFIKVYSNGVEIANSTDCKYSFKRDSRETTTKDGGNWKQLEYTKGMATVSGSFLQTTSNVPSTSALFDIMNNRTKVSVRFGGTTTGDVYWTATAILSSVDVSAPQNDNITGSYSFDIDGVPVKTVIP